MLSCRCSQLRERSHFFNIRESVLVVSNKLKWHPKDAKLCAKLQKKSEIGKFLRDFYAIIVPWAKKLFINFCIHGKFFVILQAIFE